MDSNLEKRFTEVMDQIIRLQKAIDVAGENDIVSHRAAQYACNHLDEAQIQISYAEMAVKWK